MDVTLQNITNSNLFTVFENPGKLAKGLPGIAYTAEDFFHLEQDKLFPNSWVCVGYSHDFQEAGDVRPVDVAGKPIVLVRNEAGDIGAFQNVCRHRCMKLVDKATNVGRLLKCPYHAWSYDLDGALRAAPHFGGMGVQKPDSFNFEDHGLVPVACATWGQWIFVNLNGNAGSIEDHVAPMVERLQGVDLDDLRLVGVLDFGEVATNWKFLMENFIEPYHVPVVHKTTTDQPLGDHYVVMDRNCLGSAVDISRDEVGEGKAGSLAVSSRYLTLFPNFILGRYFPDQLGVYVNLPVAPNKTRQYRAIYKTNGTYPTQEESDHLMQLWWDVHKEDHEMCERMQQGRAADIAADGGVLSPHWETSVRAFQELVYDAVK